MGVRRFEELIAWQLAAELRDRVVALTATEGVARDFTFCDQIRRASGSAPADRPSPENPSTLGPQNLAPQHPGTPAP